MTKKDIAILLSPSIVFVGLAIVALSFSQKLVRLYSSNQTLGFEQAITTAKAGEVSINQEQMIQAMELSREVVANYREASLGISGLFRGFAWFALLGIVLQAISVLKVRRRLLKT